MRRRAPLTILAAVALVAVVVLALRASGWRGRADAAAADSLATARAESAGEPPCVAARLGLPCR